MKQVKVLIVDDEAAIERMLRPYFESEGFHTLSAANGDDAIALAEREHPDVILLDLQLPGIGGFEVLRRLRERLSRVFVIMLTARVDEVDRVVGLELGADDYVTKPFSPREVAARVKAVMRRTLVEVIPHAPAQPSQADHIVAGRLTVNLTERTAHVDGSPIDLTPTEFRLLRALASEPGRAFSRAELLDRVDRDALDISERSLDTHIAHLRRKVEPDAGKPRYILTVFGHGYKFSKTPS